MPSEISGLPPLRGYLKLENLVVRLHFPYVNLPGRCPAFIERPIEDASQKTVPPMSVAQPRAVGDTAPDAPISQEHPAAPAIVHEPFFR
jgi:hypothetical protein